MIIPDDQRIGYFNDVEVVQSLNPYEDDYLVPRTMDQKNVPMFIIKKPRLDTFLFS